MQSLQFVSMVSIYLSVAAAFSALLSSLILKIENCHFSAPLISYSVRDSLLFRLNVIVSIFLYQDFKI